MAVRASFRLEAWKLRQPFSISRDTTEELGLVHCRIDRGPCTGFSEAAGVDYHGPLLLAWDRVPAILFDGPMMQPFGAEVWG
jgi:hypothetical protein